MSFLSMENSMRNTSSLYTDSLYDNSIHTESYFSTCLKHIEDFDNAYIESTSALYESLSDDTCAVNESFDDFFKKVSDAIESLSDNMDKVYSNFARNYQKGIDTIVSNPATLKYASMAPTPIVYIGPDRYKYTIRPDVPISNIVANFTAEKRKIESVLKSTASTKQKINSIHTMYNDAKKLVKSDTFDAFRGKVIKRGPIKSGDFSKELFNVYRNGGDTLPKKITKEELQEAIDIVSKNNSATATVKKQKDDIQKSYKDITKQLQDLELYEIANNLDGNVMELSAKVDLYMKEEINVISAKCKIQAAAFGAKLDAISNQYIQAKKTVLYAAGVTNRKMNNGPTIVM